MPEPMNMDEVRAALEQAKDRWDHADAPYNPDVLALIRAAESMYAKLAGIGAPPEQVRDSAVTAAMTVFGHVQVGVDRALVGSALDAAAMVYAAADENAEQRRVERIMAETGFAGMGPIDDGMRIQLTHSADLAASMVAAFDAMLQHASAPNYREWESTVTDPARRTAIDEGLPPDQWPPVRKYTFIVVAPGGKTPHQLREQAERERDAVQARLDAAHDRLTRIYDGDIDDFTTLESTVEYVVRQFGSIAESECQASSALVRARSDLGAIEETAIAHYPSAEDALAAVRRRAHRSLEDTAAIARAAAPGQHPAFAAANRLAPAPATRDQATAAAWVRHYAAIGLAAHSAFRARLARPGPELGWLSLLGVAATAAATALMSDDSQLAAEGIWGALNGEGVGWLTRILDTNGINPAAIDDQYTAADWRSPMPEHTDA